MRRLREKKTAQFDFLSNAEDERDDIEAAIDEDSSPDYDIEATKPKPRSRKKKGRTIRSHKKKIRQPELFDLVIGALGRADVFDGDSLKALRLCSKAMKFLVDDSKVLTKFDFCRGRGNYEEFSKFLVHADALQHLQSLFLHGKMDLRNATRFVLASPPNLKKLSLERCGEALEVLLCGHYPQLTSLVADAPSGCDIFSIIKEGSRSWPLVELSLTKGSGSFQNFADALSRFSGLRKLKFETPRFFGNAADPTVLQGSLQHLEDLSIFSNQSSSNMDKIGLFNANGPTLPSIRKFYCYTADGANTFLTDCPWLKNVIDLRFTSSGSTVLIGITDALFMNLDGGMVETMEMRGCSVDVDTFSRIDLPCLKEITFSGCFRGGLDILECMAAGGGLPLLESLTIDISRDADPLNFMTPGSVAAFAAAHRRLTKFSISNFRCDAAALQQFSALLLPQLEELKFSSAAMGGEDLVAALLTGAKNDDHDGGGGGGSMDEEEKEEEEEEEEEEEDDEKDENVAWPNLRVLRFYELSGPFTHEMYENILALAPLCPNLSHLTMSTRWREGGLPPSVEEVEVMANSAIEINAWPALEHAYLWFASRESNKIKMLQRAWPHAEIVGPYE